MELQYLLFCLALLASAASFSIPERFPEQGNASLHELAYSHSRCKCSDGKCVTDNRGNVKCVCKPGYAIQDEFTCKPCDCGKKGQCIFTLSPKSRGDFKYEKKCVCDVGSAEKDGKCIDCYCGENSACEFDGEEKNCYCIEGYSEKDGKCTKCDCGFYGTCEFKKGIKQCTCDEGSLELNGICEECDCGDHGTCTFRDGTKYCQCKDMFKDNEGTCEECNCGENSVECSFSGGKKVCRCNKGFSEKNGLCEVCDCGLNSFGCTFYENQKNCACQPGYVQKGHTCVVACSIDRPCKNGGTCIYGHCSCLPGTRGEFCEIIDGCEYLCPQQPDVTCSYDVKRKKPYCECLGSDLSFDEEKKKCQRTCNEEERYCFNGGECARFEYGNFCRCKVGTEGDFCDKVPECMDKDCGEEAACVYDVISSRAVCQCYDWLLSYDVRDKRCKKTCTDTVLCENGGKCTHSDVGSYCVCNKGTEGDLCKIVTDCQSKDCGNEATCVYDVTQERGVCRCNDPKLSLDPNDKICKKTCTETVLCENGGICTDTDVGSYCVCKDGTEGDLCEKVTDCQNKDCGNEATCVYDVTQERGVCRCYDTELSLDPNDKICKKTCNDEVLCLNGGTCTSTDVGGYCVCKDGTEGDLCDVVTDCKRKDCGNEATCVYDVTQERAVCRCNDPELSLDPNDKICKQTCNDEVLCMNGGTCTSTDVGGYCVCKDGTEGDLCDVVTDCKSKDCGKEATCVYDVTQERAVCRCNDPELSLDPKEKICKRTCDYDDSCKNGGQCGGTGLSKFCECLPGTVGDFCEKVGACDFKDCGTDAECVYRVEEKAAVCSCRDEKLKFDEQYKKCRRTCDLNYPCRNGGESVAGFCLCPVGTSGDYCEVVPDCETKDCGYDAKCTYSLERRSAVCTCVDDRRSFDEIEKTCKRGCTTHDDCKNGGRCRRNGFPTQWLDSAFCDCLSGTTGDLCEVVKDCEEGRIRCEGNAYCVFDQNRLEGVCACNDVKKRYDVLGKECRETCTEDASCHNGGLCVHRGDHLFCECNVGTDGHLCENVVECQRGLCGHSGDVDCIYDVEKMAAVCRCKNREQIFDPATKTCKACDCGKNSISCRYKDGKIDCVCREGYEVKKGKCQKTKCTEKRCQNGKCQVVNDKEVCSCYEGYQLEGDYCRKLNCSKTPCYNGTCVVRYGNREECICQDGYSLKDGFCIRGACKVTTCYGGRCDIIDGELMCVCPKNFSLQGKGCYETVCKKRHCFGGSCAVNKNKEEICTCLEGYILVNDVCKKVLCKKPCYGGQCKFIDGKEECICPPGFSIFEDVCRENKARRWSAYKK